MIHMELIMPIVECGIQFKTTILKSRLDDYSNADILIK